MRRLFDLLFLSLSLSLSLCVCACVETRTVMISGGNDDKSQTTLRIGRRRDTPVKKEFRRARARALYFQYHGSVIYSNLSLNHSFSLSLWYRSETMMIENREWWWARAFSLSLSLSFIYEDTCVSLSPLVRTKTRSNEQTNRYFRFFFASLLRSFIARTQHVSHKHTHTHTRSAVVV